ncbi:S-layer homology domain-containing protein [Bifidobacterium miconisargentati]|uniref:S-layer homology domain-containing protein n=1 Tax=Bifidobacterium miconisargentati TaxID=2834437 RepID=UPI001BDCF939|nr:S-layer homology domain-containing protein [Bifidobacterium miconisargentati]MBW3091345.1 S-layer homology domain-containing protein [Bifidobacterium miconisargentati]
MLRSAKSPSVLLRRLLSLITVFAMGLALSLVVTTPAHAATTLNLGAGTYWANLPNGIPAGKYQVNLAKADNNYGVEIRVYHNDKGTSHDWYNPHQPSETQIINVPAGSHVQISSVDSPRDNTIIWKQLTAYTNYGVYSPGSPRSFGEGTYQTSQSDGIPSGKYQVNIAKADNNYGVTIRVYHNNTHDYYNPYLPTDTQIIDVPAGSRVEIGSIDSPKDNVVYWRKLTKSPAYQRVKDVNSSTPHSADITALIKSGISTGWEEADGSVTFRPGNTVIRQDMAAFLYRLAGSPSFTPNWSANPFKDVNQKSDHAKEVMWLYSTGITKGYADGTFGGTRPVVRQDMAAFLHRFANKYGSKPATGAGVAFKDVNAQTPHADDIAWLAKAGISTGYSDGTFGGERPVVRQDMAAFLMRMK